MDSKAGTIGVSTRPAGFTLWTVAVSALAAAALIMSAVAITMAAGDRASTGVASRGINTVTSTGVALWDAAKLEAMEGRMAAESARIDGDAPTWDAAKLEAMEGRVAAESARIQGDAPTWDAAKLEAMAGLMDVSRP
jgi:hypothetical protein